MYSINEQFFTTDSREREYVLGFLMSDGYLSSDGELGWYLSSKDVEILRKIKNTLQCDHPIKFQKSKWGEYARLRIKNKSIANQLKNIGITNNTTGEEFFPQECQNYGYDFIRGVFDGDGCVKLTNKKNNCTNSWSICSTNLMFLENIQNYIGCGKICQSTNINYLTVYDKNHLDNIYDHLYNDTNLFLQRKYDIFTQIKNTKLKRRLFTDEETNYIIRNIHNMTVLKIAKKLNRSKGGIYSKIKDLKLKEKDLLF